MKRYARERFFAVGNDIDGVSAEFEPFFKGLRELFLIFNKKYFHSIWMSNEIISTPYHSPENTEDA